MAVVAEYKFNHGTVSILDDEIRDVTAEEMDRRIAEVRRTAWRIAEAKARRERDAVGGPPRASAPTREG